MNNYIIAVNLDGTLLNDDNQISLYNKLILKKCKELGCKIAINTSRNYMRTVRYQEEIGADFVNCFNGNLVIGNEIVYKNAFSKKLTEQIIQILKNKNINFLIELLNGTYRTRFKEYERIESYYFKPNSIKLNDCFKILVECKKEEANNIINELNDIELTFSFDEKNNFLRIMPKNSNKYYGLQKIVKKNYKLISFGCNNEDYKTLCKSFLGIKMENSSDKLKSIQFKTLSNNDNGVGVFLNNYFNFDINFFFDNVKILDCTLRDGGHLNNSYFGYKKIYNIIKKLSSANIDYIEIGFLEDCTYNKNIAKFSKVEDAEELLKNINCKKSNICVLTQVDKFDIKKLNKCSGKVKMIRVSFHSNLIDEGIKYCKEVHKKGYICACNPINFSDYSNEQIIELVKKVNKVNIDYFTIVDTFGLMLNNDFKNKLNLLSSLLKEDIKIGLHLHDNLSSSFSTAQILVQNKSRFNEIIIDTSLNGMGRSPGNLKTELLAYYINLSTKRYNLKHVYSLLENEIKQYKKQYDWSNDFRYSISAFEKSHRSYAEYLIKNNIGYEDTSNIIKKLPRENKGRYNEKLIKKLAEKYFEEE